MEISKEFYEKHAAILSAYGEKYDKLDNGLDTAIKELNAAESRRLSESTEPESPIGTRVWCSSYKRPGTVIAARVVVNTRSGDYYAPRSGPGSYVRDLDDEYEFDQVAYWVYTIKTDPSPKKGFVQEFTCHLLTLLGDDGERLPRSPRVWASDDDDATDDDDDAVRWAVQNNFGI